MFCIIPFRQMRRAATNRHFMPPAIFSESNILRTFAGNYIRPMQNDIETPSGTLHYHVSGSGADVVLLHGWGCNIDIWKGVIEDLERSFRVWAIDFPGFGKSPAPSDVWGVEEYTKNFEQFVQASGIRNPILVGHSFGGRVAIRYGARNKVNKIILVDAAGVKPRRSIDYYVKVYSFKLLKKVLPVLLGPQRAGRIIERYRSKNGSSDYKALSGTMRGTFVKVVNEDLKKFMPLISAPTLLVWGEADTATPIADARIMEKRIPDAGLVVFKGAGHYSFLERAAEFSIIINNFLRNDK